MSLGLHILEHLSVVGAERAARHSEPGLNARVLAVKSFQQRRFRHTYADLLNSTRYRPAATFFLEELYGPDDFSQRDAQFARVVPAMVRLFPAEIVGTVATLSELHALSEQLDTAMGRALTSTSVSTADYIVAWRASGTPSRRSEQIDLTLRVASSLDGLTRRSLLRNSLRLMRRPANAAGLGELQRFLERGFDNFKAMNGAREFISLVETRERTLASALFGTSLAGPACDQQDVFALLPESP
ncbi:MAG: hypothetical protein ABI671_20245 [Burkholderiales bacterium]